MAGQQAETSLALLLELRLCLRSLDAEASGRDQNVAVISKGDEVHFCEASLTSRTCYVDGGSDVLIRAAAAILANSGKVMFC